MCFSLPRELATIVGELRCREDRISTGEVGGDRDSSESSESSDDSESTLFDSSGKSFRLGLGLAISIAGVVASCGCVSQQSVSRFQMRQLRFSSLRPFSIESAHLEKTEGLVSYLHCPVLQSVLTTPHAEQVLNVSSIDLAHPASVDG